MIFVVNLISYQCMGDEGINCDLSICYIVYKSDKGIAGVTSFIGVKVNTMFYSIEQGELKI